MNISELFDLHGRTLLITGGSGVLGRVMAIGLAQAGSRVAVLGRRERTRSGWSVPPPPLSRMSWSRWMAALPPLAACRKEE